MMWYANEVADDGEKFLANMVDLLWYIDGHHDVFNCRNKKSLKAGQDFLDIPFLKHQTS